MSRGTYGSLAALSTLGWKLTRVLPEGNKPMHTTIKKELP